MRWLQSSGSWRLSFVFSVGDYLVGKTNPQRPHRSSIFRVPPFATPTPLPPSIFSFKTSLLPPNEFYFKTPRAQRPFLLFFFCHRYFLFHLPYFSRNRLPQFLHQSRGSLSFPMTIFLNKFGGNFFSFFVFLPGGCVGNPVLFFFPTERGFLKKLQLGLSPTDFFGWVPWVEYSFQWLQIIKKGKKNLFLGLFCFWGNLHGPRGLLVFFKPSPVPWDLW